MKLSASFTPWTPAAVADTTNFTDSGHHTIQGGVAGQRSELVDVQIGGLASASAPTALVLGRTSTVGATLTAGRLAPVDATSTLIANPPVSFQVSTTKPQRSSTLGMLLNFAFNAFGGLIRWTPGQGEVIASSGAAASVGELSLNCTTGGGTPGLLGATIIIETV